MFSREKTVFAFKKLYKTRKERSMPVVASTLVVAAMDRFRKDVLIYLRCTQEGFELC